MLIITQLKKKEVKKRMRNWKLQYRLLHEVWASQWLDGKESACNAGDLGSILEDPLEKEMATRSSIFAWEIPWREEPSRLQSMRLQRVGHD